MNGTLREDRVVQAHVLGQVLQRDGLVMISTCVILVRHAQSAVGVLVDFVLDVSHDFNEFNG